MKIKKGFTLIELIVVIAIIGILSLILVPQVTGYINDAKDVACLSNGRQLVNEISGGYALGKIDEQDLIDNDGQDVSEIISLLGLSYDIQDCGCLFQYADGNIDVVCNGDVTDEASNDDNDTNDDVTNDDKTKITFTDDNNNSYILEANNNFDEIKDYLGKDNVYGFNIKKGSILSDGESVYIATENDYIHDPNLDDYSLSELVDLSSNFMEISSDNKIYTSEYLDTVDTNDKNNAFEYKKGDIKVETIDGQLHYYYQRASGDYDQANGRWLEVNLGDIDY